MKYEVQNYTKGLLIYGTLRLLPGSQIVDAKAWQDAWKTTVLPKHARQGWAPGVMLTYKELLEEEEVKPEPPKPEPKPEPVTAAHMPELVEAEKPEDAEKDELSLGKKTSKRRSRKKTSKKSGFKASS